VTQLTFADDWECSSFQGYIHQYSASTQTEENGNDRTQPGKVVSTGGMASRPSSRFEKSSTTGTVDKNGSNIPLGPAIPLSEKRTASMPVTPFLEQSVILGSPGPSSSPQNAAEVI